ncbi:uncharacterized protein LOC133195201 [Saccostrea echinata]|uniref:uncharacterized protein LOC133195201 n=1 Tax=Saccostrea echinata TaxID=191078 RepID=UPI002A83EADD|nr:uncharacterized protein LOC133195201 [Saccostrea echinata]
MAICFRPCVHGDRTANGKCVCKPCWTGESCDAPRNRYTPKFSQDEYYASVSDLNSVFFVPDQEMVVCQHADKCACAEVSFSVLTGNEDGLFTIDPLTGALSISQGAVPKKNRYVITVKVTNQLISNNIKQPESIASVIVVFPGFQSGMESHHHIEKRATSSVVGNVTFDLTKKYPYNETTEMKVGSRVRFQLIITFPIEDTDMLVELFTPDNETTVMILCDVNVTNVGSSLTFNGSKIPTMDARETGSVMYDRAIINFGVVQNSGCTTADECSIYIEYEAILLENPSTNAGEVYWVSAGAEYNNENEVWVGQASFVAFPNDTVVTENPIVNFTGPSSLSVGSAGVFQVDLLLPNPSTTLSFDAFAPINTSSVMSICSAKLKYISDNFKCGFDERAVSAQYYPDQTGIGNSMGHLTLGTMINKGSRDAANIMENNLVSVEFVAHMYNDPSFVGTNNMVGAAFEIGSAQIWAGQMQVTGSAEVDASAMASPILEFNPPSGQTVAMGDAITLLLEVQIPQSTTTSYTLEIKAPFSTTAVFKVCTVEIKTIGENMPCVHKEDKKTVYSSRDSGASEPDTGTLNLGGITNLNINATADASTIAFEIVVAPLNHSAATDMSSHNVEATLTYAGSSTVVQSTSILISGTSVLVTSVSNTTSPSFDMKYLFGTEYVEVGTATRAQLEITTNRSVSYPMMNMEFIMPLGNTSTKLSICRARMLSAGRNLPCVSPDWINTQVTYQSQYNETVNDQALMYLSTVCNYERVDNVTDDIITIILDVKVEDNPELITGVKEWISAGNQYSDTKIWVGQLALYAQRSGTIIPATNPYINLIRNTTLSSIPIGYPSVYTALIKVAPEESAKVKVSVTLGNTVLSICGMRIKDIGDNFPCVDKNVTSSFSGTSGFIDIGIVTNTGSDALVMNDFYDSNTILVELLIQLADDTATVTNGGSYTFDVEVEYGSDGRKQSFPSQTIIASHDKTLVNFTSVNNRTTNTFYTENIGSNNTDLNIMKGESKRFLLDMVFPEGEIQDVTVKFMTSIAGANQNMMELCGSGLTVVGENFPCLDKTTVNPVYTKRAGSLVKDTVTLQLGFVCSSGVKSGDNEANKLRLEAVARLLPTSTLSAGSTIPFHVAVNTNDVEIYVGQIDLIVSGTPTVTNTTTNIVNTSLLYINSSSDPLPLNVGVVTTLPISLYVPPDTMSKVLFDIELPVHSTVTLGSIEDIRISSSGSNIQCVYEDDALSLKYERKYNSTTNTCQQNHGELDMGTVTNSGISQRVGTHTETDDVIQIEVDIRVNDNVPDTAGSEFPLSLGAKVADYIVIYEKNVTLARTGNERPNLEITATFNSALSTSSSIVIDTILKHTNLTSATAVNATVFFYLPPYLGYKQIQSNVTHSGPLVTGGTVELQFDDLAMCEVVNVQLTLEPNQTITVPLDILTENTLIAYEANAYMIYNPASVYPSDKYFDTPLQYLNFSVTVTKAGVCDEPLGMASGHIDDCQLDGSIENDPARPPSHGRYNGNSAWRPFSRGPTFSKYRYFQVFFGNKTLVNKIIIQKGSGYTHHPTQLSLRYSNDGYSWQTAETVTVTVPFTETTVYPQRQTQARYMRVYIDKDDTVNGLPPDIGLKFEFFGCYLSGEFTTTNICNDAPNNISPNDFYFRSFHALSDKVLMCDINPNDRDLKQHCHYSMDGNTWAAMDRRVASLLGHESSGNLFFAYGNDQRSTLMSKDGGITWDNVPRDYYIDTRSEITFTPSKNVPMQVTNLAVAEPHTSYQFGSWGVTFEGLWKNSAGVWSKVVEWDICC